MGIGNAIGGLLGFGSDDNDELDEAQREQAAMMNQQIEETKAELSQKRMDIYQRALNIKKSQGGEIWKSNKEGINTGSVKTNQGFNSEDTDKILDGFPSGFRPIIKENIDKYKGV